MLREICHGYFLTGHHSSMLNITSRLAIRLRYLPDWEFDWSDTQPQRSRESLTISDFLPDEHDAAELKSRAIHYVMRILMQNFKHLRDLAQYAPDEQPFHPSQKAEVAPMKDEKFTSETIDILSKLVEDGNLQGDYQVIVYTTFATPYSIHVQMAPSQKYTFITDDCWR